MCIALAGSCTLFLQYMMKAPYESIEQRCPSHMGMSMFLEVHRTGDNNVASICSKVKRSQYDCTPLNMKGLTNNVRFSR